jgi:chaperone required for assembly of F1-ATPase
MTEETENDRMRRLVTDQYVRPLPKRFYKTVGVTSANEIVLDRRLVKTPLKAVLALPNRALADAVAAEWDTQKGSIDAASMHLTKLANTAIDRASAERANLIEELVRYANSDLVCYRAEGPPRLLARQDEIWDPIIDWAQRDLRALFKTTQGIVHVDQPPEALDAVRNRLEDCDPFALTAIHSLSTLLGTILISLKIRDKSISIDNAWVAAHLDEDFQIEDWGEDEELAKRRAARRIEYDATVKFLHLLSSSA